MFYHIKFRSELTFHLPIVMFKKIAGGRAALDAHGKSRAAREDWSPMEPPSFPPSGLLTVRAAPGSPANLVLPLPAGSPPFVYTWYVHFLISQN
ncbi:unnamed protein product [Arctia plantaginis]|uniref:Uncharacterized protein n=1 Tax=Arctia plantaginis TaxID=874455 RepID=A0A8S0Z3J8_ARCPL|nr:unnamed protein product [Arctia plantaginis]